MNNLGEENAAMQTKAMQKMLTIANRLKKGSPQIFNGKQRKKNNFFLKKKIVSC